MSFQTTPIEAETNDLASSSNTYEFTHAATKLAVSQICQTTGYQNFKSPALESLTGFTIQYILHIGKTATTFANLTGRTHSNVFDIVLALQDLTGSNKSVIQSIIDFVNLTEEIPFTQSLPNIPINKNKSKMIPSFVEIGETPPGSHIPVWLPAFPDEHTYKETPMWIERGLDARGDKIEQARQRRKGERALLSLQRRFVTSRYHSWGDIDGVMREPLSSSPKSLSKDGLSVVDAFAHVKDGLEMKKKKGRVVVGVVSKLRSEKKFLGEPLDLSLKMKGGDEERGVLFVREEDRDDRRKRAEFILRQCMENPVDLNQM